MKRTVYAFAPPTSTSTDSFVKTMEFHGIGIIARQELIINIRNRWVLLFAIIFGVLVLTISYFGLVTAGAIGFQGFARTSASLLNFVLYVIPLVSLIMGTQSFTSEKSTNELLFSQPVTRTEILLGKLAGLFASMFVATLIGFGLAGLVIAIRAGTAGSLRYPAFVGLSLVLTFIFLSLSVLVSVFCQRRPVAYGFSLFVWFFFVLFYDLIVIGGTFLLPERAANRFLFLSLLGNPVGMVRVASLIILDGKEIFGAAGAALLRFFGGEVASIVFLLAGLLVWLWVPVWLAQSVLKRQDI